MSNGWSQKNSEHLSYQCNKNILPVLVKSRLRYYVCFFELAIYVFLLLYGVSVIYILYLSQEYILQISARIVVSLISLQSCSWQLTVNNQCCREGPFDSLRVTGAGRTYFVGSVYLFMNLDCGMENLNLNHIRAGIFISISLYEVKITTAHNSTSSQGNQND